MPKPPIKGRKTPTVNKVGVSKKRIEPNSPLGKQRKKAAELILKAKAQAKTPAEKQKILDLLKKMQKKTDPMKLKKKNKQIKKKIIPTDRKKLREIKKTVERTKKLSAPIKHYAEARREANLLLAEIIKFPTNKKEKEIISNLQKTFHKEKLKKGKNPDAIIQINKQLNALNKFLKNKYR